MIRDDDPPPSGVDGGTGCRRGSSNTCSTWTMSARWLPRAISIGGVRPDGRGLGQPRQPEVHDLDVALAGEHDVRVSDRSARMPTSWAFASASASWSAIWRAFFSRGRPRPQKMPKGRPLDELHRNYVDLARGYIAEVVVDRDDGRVVHAEIRPGFLLETPDGRGVGGRLDVQDFDRDIPSELRRPARDGPLPCRRLPAVRRFRHGPQKEPGVKDIGRRRDCSASFTFMIHDLTPGGPVHDS